MTTRRSAIERVTASAPRVRVDRTTGSKDARAPSITLRAVMALGLMLLAPTACVGLSTAPDGSVATDATDAMDAPRSDIPVGAPTPSAWAVNAANAQRTGGRSERASAAGLIAPELGGSAAVSCPSGQIDCGGMCFPTTMCSAGVGGCARTATATCAALGVSVGAGLGFSCALVSGGTVRCWGDGTLGQMGDRTNVSKSTPVPVLTGASGTTPLSNVIQVAVGYQHACALISDGTVRCWGSNGAGQIGDRTTTNRNIPATVLTGTTGTTALTGVGAALLRRRAARHPTPQISSLLSTRGARLNAWYFARRLGFGPRRRDDGWHRRWRRRAAVAVAPSPQSTTGVTAPSCGRSALLIANRSSARRGGDRVREGSLGGWGMCIASESRVHQRCDRTKVRSLQL